jgi:hypothetical protein
MKTAMLAPLALLLAGPAVAVEDYSTGTLQSWCTSQDVGLRLACKSYIKGVFDVMQPIGEPGQMEDRSLFAVCTGNAFELQRIKPQISSSWSFSAGPIDIGSNGVALVA